MKGNRNKNGALHVQNNNNNDRSKYRQEMKPKTQILSKSITKEAYEPPRWKRPGVREGRKKT